MKNEYSIPGKYKDFCKEVVELLNEFYEDKGVSANLLIGESDIYITVRDKSGFYESTTGLLDINIERSVNDNAKHIVDCAVKNFIHRNFD